MNRRIFLQQTGAAMAMGATLKTFAAMTKNTQSGERLPVLFVGHGTPMNAIEENEITRGWQRMVQGLTPSAILCISAHWETAGTRVTAAPAPKTIHDFYGFPPELYAVNYPAPGSPALAGEIRRDVQAVTVQEDHEWGLDHGAWSVIRHMFPAANIPVLQLSLDRGLSPRGHAELAASLSFLRRRGVLIVGSGNLVHNIRAASWDMEQAYDWAAEFDEQARRLIISNDLSELARSDRLSRAAALSIPTPEHWLPLLYAVGLRESDERVAFFNEVIQMGSMSMRSFVIS